MTIPIAGQFVLYRLTEDDATRINKRFNQYEEQRNQRAFNPMGGTVSKEKAADELGHRGSYARRSDIYPALVVRVLDEPEDSLQLQVFLDGNDTFWASDVSEGRWEGCWHVPDAIEEEDDEKDEEEKVVPEPIEVPTLGRIVYYKLSVGNAQVINQRRADYKNFGNLAQIGTTTLTGYIGHQGNTVYSGEVFPAMITKVWGKFANSAVQLQVFLDGTDTFWATSVVAGSGNGHFRYTDES